MEYEEAYALLQKHGQEHVLKYFYKLKEEQQSMLLSYIAQLDLSVLQSLDGGKRKLGDVAPADVLNVKQIRRNKGLYEQTGIDAIKQGKVACVMLAGGQGSRLGSAAPKGTYNMGLTRELSIFECQINNLKESCERAGKAVHLFIMTSDVNDEATRNFFESHKYFGYDKKKIHFFLQDLTPALSFDYKILMEEKYKPVLVPGGNGGWFNSLMKAGFGRLLKREGIEWLNLYGVDNVLQRSCDPLFVGATIAKKAACGAKVVKKASPEEKVGVLCIENGVPSIIEYYEMPKRLKIRRNVQGDLTFGYGVILNYLFSVEKLKETMNKKLPYHLAEKKINCIKSGRHFVPEEPNAYKLETLAVDLVKNMGTCLGFEVVREKEFAPVKNATGVDSVVTARELLVKNGVEL